MPVEAKVAAGNGEVGGHGQFLAGAKAKQGAIVADAQTEAAGSPRNPASNLTEQSEFTLGYGTAGDCFSQSSTFLRIG
jgi:hypothetical protein